jgi:CheY-like chemotaxis protein
MKVFCLEDMDVRISVFKKRYANDELTIAKTANEAIAILEKGLDYDLYLLDHDLGGEIFCSSKLENSGYRVAEFLSDKNVKGDIVIHSWNPIGAQNMLAILPTAVYRPFSI